MLSPHHPTSACHHPTSPCHHDHTIKGKFMTFTSSPFWLFVVPWLHKVIVTSLANYSLEDTTLTMSKHPWPTWTWTKSGYQTSLTQGMSAFNLSANILDQCHLTVPCSAALLSSRIMPTWKLTSHKYHILVCILYLPPYLISSLPRSSCFERQRGSLSPMSRKIARLLPSRFATRVHIPNSHPPTRLVSLPFIFPSVIR